MTRLAARRAILVLWVTLAGAACGSSGGPLPLAVGAKPGVDGSGVEVPTVDVSGRWQGRWFSSSDPATGLLANLTLAQSGNDFQGNLNVIGAELIPDTRPINGTVFGTKFDGDFDSGLGVADCFADIVGRRMNGTYQFHVPFQNEFGTFNLKHD